MVAVIPYRGEVQACQAVKVCLAGLHSGHMTVVPFS
jgi:hypothetical protein